MSTHSSAGYIRPVGDPTDLRVRGRALLVASAVGVVLLAGAWWAASVDLASEYERNAAPLDALSTLYKVLSVVGLALVGRTIGSRSMRLLALLLALMTVGSLLVDEEWFVSGIRSVADFMADVLPLSSGFVELAGLFLALAAVAGTLISMAFAAMRPEEKIATMTLIALLFVLGIFVGPVNAIASEGINREWLFAEDFGQVVAMAIVTAYVAGLLAAVGSSLPSR